MFKNHLFVSNAINIAEISKQLLIILGSDSIEVGYHFSDEQH